MNKVGLELQVKQLKREVQELAAELMAAIHEPMYSGTRADWVARAQSAEHRLAQLQDHMAAHKRCDFPEHIRDRAAGAAEWHAGLWWA